MRGRSRSRDTYVVPTGTWFRAGMWTLAAFAVQTSLVLGTSEQAGVQHSSAANSIRVAWTIFLQVRVNCHVIRLHLVEPPSSPAHAGNTHYIRTRVMSTYYAVVRQQDSRARDTDYIVPSHCLQRNLREWAMKLGYANSAQ